MRIALLLALLVHGGLLLFAYLSPPVQPPPRRKVIRMEVVRREPPPPPAPAVDRETPQRPAEAPPRTRLPESLRPVARADKKDDPESPAAVLPEQPQKKEPDPGGPRRPINLFPGSLAGVVDGAVGVGAVPKGPDRLLKDERLEEKKEPEFHLVPDKGGGYVYKGEHFNARIGPDGALSFENKFPIGFQKGQTGFSFDLTDLVSRGAKVDPYAAEKRKFAEHTEKLRQDLRKQKRDGILDQALANLPAELAEIWGSDKPAAIRRRELFERWVECADDKDGADSSGRRARRTVEEFIRRHLPPSSPLAYTEEELRRFAMKREGLPQFNPYEGR